MKNEWIEFEPTFYGITPKRKSWHYWAWVRIKSFFGVKTKIEFEKTNPTMKTEYKIDGKICTVRFTGIQTTENKMSVTLPKNLMPDQV